MAKEIGMICEQGDMGLWNTPLSESDRKILEQQERKQKEDNKKSSEKNYGGRK